MEIDTTPIALHPYFVLLGIRDKVKDELLKLKDQGVIVRSHSPWSSPLVPVKMPNGEIRLCVDYRRVNEVTKKDPFYMPCTGP